MRRPLLSIAGALAVLSLVTSPIAAAASSMVPPGFVGVNIDGLIFAPPLSAKRQLASMVATGVQSVRVVFDWSQAQPYPDWKAVPPGRAGGFAPGPVPTSFAVTDGIVRLAAQRGLSVLPVVLYAPGWDQLPHPPGTLAVPRRDGPYGDYLRRLVLRYGPGGSFWSSHPAIPKLPIRMWQIWNEPNTRAAWPALFVPGYVRLLRAAHRALRRADPRAQVVLGGMPNFAWRDLATLYRHGAGRLFDAVAAHPYTSTPQGVIVILGRIRRVMDRHGDRGKPILITEFGWPSSLHQGSPPLDFETTEAGQARRLARFLGLLAGDRPSLGVTAFYYYTWIGSEARGQNPFAFSGLLALRRDRVVVKPAYGAFRRSVLALEGCARKAAVATRCAQPT